MNRRHFLVTAGAALGAARLWKPRIERPRPTDPQLRWQREELSMFLHFGVNTFTDREWGDGREDPALFNPASLDARQWTGVAKAAGFKSIVLTAKHHDGFCLWPTATTKHSVASSPFRSGTGDVVREFTNACRAEGLGAGVYLSPWDRNNPSYGDSARYNDLYCAQLTELLTLYGPISEVWFDGANGEGQNGKKQVYDWPRVWSLVLRLQPNAVIFSDAGPDVRWCGNERGVAGDPNWSTVDPSVVTFPGADGPGIIDSLQHGSRTGSVWRPAEVDVSIRPGWFHHPAEDAKVRSAASLFELYCTSVGRNGKLLLNVPPTRDGVLHASDVAALQGFTALRSAWQDAELTRALRPLQSSFSEAIWDFDFGRTLNVSAVRLEEAIAWGQNVSRYTLYGTSNNSTWTILSRGTTIGYAKIDRFPTASVRALRLAIDDAVEFALPVRLNAYP